MLNTNKGRELSCEFCILRWIKWDAAATLNDAKLLNYFKEVDQLPDAEQHVILKVITAYLRDLESNKLTPNTYISLYYNALGAWQGRNYTC